jgi:hypothetical protein
LVLLSETSAVDDPMPTPALVLFESVEFEFVLVLVLGGGPSFWANAEPATNTAPAHNARSREFFTSKPPR